MAAADGLPLPKAFKLDGFPIDRLDPGGDLMALLSKILVTDYSEEIFDPGPGGKFEVGLTVEEELVLNLVGVDGFAIVLGGASMATFLVGVEMRPNEFKVKLGAGARLRFPRGVLKPVIADGDAWVDDPTRSFAEIEMIAAIVIDQDWNVTFDGANAFTLAPAMIADSGFVVEGEVALDFSETTGLPESAALGLPPTWRGVVFRTLQVHLPKTITDAVPIASIAFENFHIGSGGVSGRVRLNGAAGSAALAGFPFTPTAFEVLLKQNALIGASLAGTITLPFFDAPVGVEVGFDLSGNMTVGIKSAGDTALLAVTKPGLLAMTIESLSFARQDGVFTAAIGGTITPMVANLDWPTFRVEKLSIDSQGHVRVEGGWLDLPEQYVLGFYGFQLSISRIGFGTETDGKRWIGFNGGLKLVDGLSAGASVEGMRIRWSASGPFNPSLSLEGVGVEFEVPGTVSFKGFVAMREPEPGVFRFDGDIELKLIALNLEIDGQLVIGYNEPAGFTFFAIYVGVELPAGFPLWATGLGLYGIAGLFALNMEPGRQPDEPWYGIQPGPSWYHRSPPGVGVAELRKWDDAEGSLGFGAGITIGTVVDNGFTFAGKMLFVIVFPGPILMIEGRANVLKERASLNDDPMFRTLIVLDGREGTILAGLDARYAIADDGELIDIAGSLEAFFDFNDLDAWHLYLGIDEPREKRIGADIFFHIFRTEAYFMINANRLRTGAWTGIDMHWQFGPLRVVLQAWMEGRADLSFKPVYLQGYLSIHGGFEVSVFGFGFGLGATATLSAGVFDPFYLRADLAVSVSLPWPLPDFDVPIVLEWGPEADPPLLPATVKDVTIAHEIVTTTWPLPAGTLLLPKIDTSLVPGFFDDQPPALADPDMAPPAAATLPVVPVDGRPEVTFGRPVHDDGLIGVNPQPVYPSASPVGWAWIGDPAANQGPVRVRPALTEVKLDRWSGGAWQPIARAGVGANPPGLPTLYGAWMPAPDDPGASGDAKPANVKLRVWAKTPFTFTSHTGGEWDSWITDTYANYPCIEVPPDQKICCDFSAYKRGERLLPPWSCKGDEMFALTWPRRASPVIESHPAGVASVLGLCFPDGAEPIILLKKAAKEVVITVYGERVRGEQNCVDFRGRRRSRSANPRSEPGMRFTVFAGSGNLAPVCEIRATTLADNSILSGLDVGRETRIELQAATPSVTLLISTSSPPVVAVAYDSSGVVVDRDQVTDKGRVTAVTLVAPPGKLIARLAVVARDEHTAFLHEVCPNNDTNAPIWADAYDGGGNKIDRFWQKNNAIEVDARGAGTIVVGRDRGRFCILRICVVVGLDAADKAALDRMSTHIKDELARWQADGDVLPPYSTFRLLVGTKLDVVLPPGSKVAAGFASTRNITQVAYFRTEGPPGLTHLTASGNALVPGAGGAGASVPPTIETGLEDLSRYVAQTVPATVPPPGQPPVLSRPVYRAYDVGVAFGQNYVDEMYALAGRDLSLALFDNNDQPIRDDKGRLLVTQNRWGRTDTLSLTQSEQQWLDIVSNADCTSGLLDLGTVAHNKTVDLAGFVLDPATVYEARLVPMLLHETFDGFALGATASGTGAVLAGTSPFQWSVRDFGSVDGPSVWRVGEAGVPVARYIEQTANVSFGATSRNATFPGGTMLSAASNTVLSAGDPDQPQSWTDYRLSADVRSFDDDVVGLAVRVSGPRGYLLKLDRQRGLRQLILFRPINPLLLAQSPGVYQVGLDTHVSIEVTGQRIRVHIDGEPVFDVSNGARPAGTIALYTADNAVTRFTDVRVDDLRHGAPVVYRFKLTTSDFADFSHHLHSFTDRVFATAPPDAAPIAAAAAAAIDPAGPAAGVPAGEPEARAYDGVAVGALASAAHQPVAAVEATRLLSGTATAALLLRTAEPIDWRRTLVTFASADPSVAPVPAGGAKLIDAGFASGAAPDPAQEWATVLLLERRDLAGHAIESRTLPSPDAPALAAGTSLYGGDFITSFQTTETVQQMLWQPAFANLSEVTPVVPVGIGMPNWQASAGTLSQTGSFYVPDVLLPPFGAKAERGTLAVHPIASAVDIRFGARIDMTGLGTAGLVFRYQNAQNYYRFAIDRIKKRRHLVRFVGGSFAVLHSSTLPLGAGASQIVSIDAVGNHLTVSIDGAVVASVFDPHLVAGGVGFHTHRDPQARFSAITVERLAASMGDWRIDDVAPTGARSVWRIAHGLLSKDAVTPVPPGRAFAVIANGTWNDVRVATAVQLKPGSTGFAGIVWRYASQDDHVRLEFDAAGVSATALRRTAGVDSVIWTGALPPIGASTARMLGVEAIGRRLKATVDDVLLFDAADAGIGTGSVGAFGDHGAALDVWPFSITCAVPSWEPWYVFGAEGPRTSGRRFRIAGSPAPAGYASPAGEDARWKGLLAAGFRPGFPSEGVDLRLRDAAGETLHQRRFRPDSAYTALPVRMARAQDGTGVVILPVGNPNLPDGEIRAVFSYRRDNLAVDLTSLVLSESGDTSPETARLSLG